jgi:hypothetical protein
VAGESNPEPGAPRGHQVYQGTHLEGADPAWAAAAHESSDSCRAARQLSDARQRPPRQKGRRTAVPWSFQELALHDELIQVQLVDLLREGGRRGQALANSFSSMLLLAADSELQQRASAVC